MRYARLTLLAVVAAAGAEGAVSSLYCQATAVQAHIRQEGLTERLGEVVMNCQGDVPGGDVGASLTLFVNGAAVTNRLNAEGLTDAMLEIDRGVGTTPFTVRARLIGSNALVFENVNFTLTLQALANMRIQNIRVNGTGAVDRTISVAVSTNGLSRIAVSPNPLVVGLVRPGLLANIAVGSILCVGSPLPDDIITMSTLFGAGTRVSSLRVTEGMSNSFERRQANADTGTRIVIRYSGFPAGSRVFVPDAIAGSTAAQRTSAGDLGVPRSPGRYTPGGSPGGLLLVRVRGHDVNGAGGTLAWAPPFGVSEPVLLDGASEVFLANGAGMAVYEVLDSAPSILESAHIPTFLALPPVTGGGFTVAQARVSFGPISTVSSANPFAPVPRFTAPAPGVDCAIVTDCGADYFPKLRVDAPPLVFETTAGVPGYFGKFIRILNDQGGTMVWRASIVYRQGSGWLRVSQEAGINNASIILDANPDRLPGPGVYEATLIIDAGPQAGTQMLPVTLTAAAPPQQPIVRPEITGIANAADRRVTSIVPGSRAVLTGTRLKGGQQTLVTVDGVEAQVVRNTDAEIEFVVPEGVGFRTSAAVTVTVDFVPSPTVQTSAAAAAPVIYPGGVLNQDGTVNSEDNAELVGNILQVFATGLPAAGLGQISAKIHDREIGTPLYAAGAPGLPGIQQVNFAVPDDLPAMNTEVIVCGWPANAPGQRVCSAPVVVTLRR